MNFELIQASEEHKSVIENLIQFYIYNFSEYINCDVEEDGLFGAYPDLEKYWREENHGFAGFVPGKIYRIRSTKLFFNSRVFHYEEV